MARINSSFRRNSLSIAVFMLAASLGPLLYATASSDQPKPGEPTDPKARKTYAEAIELENHGQLVFALDDYRKANKQNGSRCDLCLDHAYNLALETGDYKTAQAVTQDWLSVAKTDSERAALHARLAIALQRQGMAEKKEKCFTESCDEFKNAIALDPGNPTAHFFNGISLAYLRQDDAAKTEFQRFLDGDKDNPTLHERALRYVNRVDLARARMAPPFTVTTIDGQRVSLDSLAGKVVLIDFWATWCGPCREALPHMQKIARQFAGQPLVILSVSLDSDEAKWKDFVAKNQMTWLQYRDGNFNGPVSRQFLVNAIPATFTIDSDGVLEDQHVGDADIDGKLKRLVAQAQEKADRRPLLSASGD